MSKFPVAGDVAPDFELLDSSGARRRLSELVSSEALILVFYRGNW
jgi:peroxiredoxin